MVIFYIQRSFTHVKRGEPMGFPDWPDGKDVVVFWYKEKIPRDNRSKWSMLAQGSIPPEIRSDSHTVRFVM
jgi:hypothetical protein